MPKSRLSTQVKLLLLGACIALLSTGCFKLNMSIAVESDGTGTFYGDFAVSKQLAEVFGPEQEDLSCEEILDENDQAFDEGPLSDFPRDAVIETYEDDDWCGQRLTLTFTDFGASLDDFPLSVDGSILTFIIAGEELLGSDEGLGADFGEDEDINPMFLLQAFGIPEPEFMISVDLPGKILEHNADSLDGSTLTWELDFLDLDPDFSPFAKTDLTVDSSSGGSGRTIGIVLGIVGLVALLAAAKVAQMRVSSKDSEGDEEQQ